MLQNKDILLLLIRLFLGYIFFSSGICKLTGGEFGQLIGPPWLEEQLAQYGLGLFAKVVAVSQVLCGTLLLSQRFSLLGAIMLVPMNVAILAVTVSQQWAGTPYVNTVMLLLNLTLLLLERDKFRFLWQANRSYQISPSVTDAIGQNLYSWLGIGLCLLTLAAAPFNIFLTNAFALPAFAAFAATLLRSELVVKLDRVLLALPFVAMTFVTMGLRIPHVLWGLGGVLLLEGLLLMVRLYLGRRQQRGPVEAAALAG
ncbi:DoxX family membrane protein [Pontibacter sp. FD36]|uniref:DoxX family membrane protein n=1 Tax=Pontibacter sp. FD36 TaxID=2789860 RepID=UPI0018AA525A|nr:DoxX family membrane protein [Pontibacter sp. FD36]MBF8965054.1 DoxX family membrane protein [Pontibacter sp. FD36]